MVGIRSFCQVFPVFPPIGYMGRILLPGSLVVGELVNNSGQCVMNRCVSPLGESSCMLAQDPSELSFPLPQ